MLVSLQALASIPTVVAFVVTMGPPIDPDGSDVIVGDGVEIRDELEALGIELGVQMVSLDRARWRALQAPEPPPPRLPPPWPAAREVVLRPQSDGVVVQATWTVRSFEAGWFDAALMPIDERARVRALTIDGRDAAPAFQAHGSQQLVRAAVPVDGTSSVTLRVFIEHDPARGPLELPLMPAVRSKARIVGDQAVAWRFVDAEGEPVVVADTPSASWDAGSIRIATVNEGAPTAATARLALATVGLGVTVGEAETRTRARVTWSLRRGELSRVTMRVPDASKDLQVSGPNLRQWRREGDRIVVELSQVARERVQLELSWSRRTPTGTEGKVGLPTIAVEDAYRVEGSVQLARDGEVELFPELDGWTPRAASQLPAWSEGLVEGTPIAAFTGAPQTGGRLSLLRFEPVQGPPAVVDVAHYDLALSAEGRLIGQARYEVRNDRNAFLRIEPPAGVEIVGVRVAAEVVAPVRGEAEGTWLVPLRRSVESIEGLISFPVEVALLGSAPIEVRRGLRDRIEDQLELPRLDVPVAAQRVRLYVPPRWRSRLASGEQGTVTAFSEGEGITYGFSAGDRRGQMADDLFQSAVADWLDNDFSKAQQKLDELSEIGAENENVARLQANLDLVLGGSPRVPDAGRATDLADEELPEPAAEQTRGEAEPSPPSRPSKVSKRADAKQEYSAQQQIVARRVRQQAKARAGEDRRKMKASADKARKLRNEGRYGEAQAAYGQALELGDELANLEDDSSMEQIADNRTLREELEALEQEKNQREVVSNVGKRSSRRDAIALESEEDLPVGGRSGRDFTATVDQSAPEGDTSAGKKNENRAPRAKDDGVTVYDFEDDDVDGELLRPEDGSVASRARASASSSIDASELRAGAEERMAGAVITRESMRAEPESEPSSGEVVAMDAPASSRPRLFKNKKKRARRVGGRRRASVKPASGTVASATTSTATPAAPPSDPNASLEGPVVSASGLAVVVPTVGELVLYQQLLIPAGQRPSLTVDARELPRRRRH